MEGLFHGPYHIIEFPYVQFVILVKAGQQHVLAVEFLSFSGGNVVALPFHGYSLLLLAPAFVGEGDGVLLTDGPVLLVKPAQAEMLGLLPAAGVIALAGKPEVVVGDEAAVCAAVAVSRAASSRKSAVRDVLRK